MNKYHNLIALTGTVVLFIGLMLQFVRFEFAPYIYLIGAVLFAYVQIKEQHHGSNLIIRRLQRQQMIGAAVLVLTGVMMIVWHHNEWIAGLTIAAVLELYTAFRIPQEEAKENMRNR